MTAGLWSRILQFGTVGSLSLQKLSFGSMDQAKAGTNQRLRRLDGKLAVGAADTGDGYLCAYSQLQYTLSHTHAHRESPSLSLPLFSPTAAVPAAAAAAAAAAATATDTATATATAPAPAPAPAAAAAAAPASTAVNESCIIHSILCC